MGLVVAAGDEVGDGHLRLAAVLPVLMYFMCSTRSR
jgi:hypothetical protein